MDFFVFTDNLVFESVFYKGTSKPPFPFELVIRLYHVNMRGELISHVIYITGTRMTESGIYCLYRGNSLGGMMRGLNTLQFFVRSAKL